MLKKSQLPLVEHQQPLDSKTDSVIARSAHRLGTKHSAIWREEKISQIQRVKLVTLNHLGGQPGYSGSRLFAAALRGTKTRGGSIESQPLLLKLVENNPATAEKRRNELTRYDAIRHQLPSRAHARPFYTTPKQGKSAATRLVWSEFIDETTIAGLPKGPPTELRHVLEQNRWNDATVSLRAAYQILDQAHRGSYASVCYFDHYAAYLRMNKGWINHLRSSLGNLESIKALGTTVPNPLGLIDAIQKRPSLTTSSAHLSAVHGDLHPKNILVGKIFKACLIDFGWSQASFHTIVDFVFMEASLKFFRLPWHVPRLDLIRFERSLSSEYLPDIPMHDLSLRNAFQLIRTIREAAMIYIKSSEKNWYERQYLLPLFFVTAGLFSYPTTISNWEHLLLSSGLLAGRLKRTLGT